MKKIPLTQGKFAIVDDDDFERLIQWKWYATKDKSRCFYAVRSNNISIKMHRVILGAKGGDGKIADHINGNTLDNRKANLRFCTSSQNSQNRKKWARPKHSKYKGVTKSKRQRKYDVNETWMARIKVKGKKRIYLGHYKSEVHAAIAYNEAATKYFGEFAKLNII